MIKNNVDTNGTSAQMDFCLFCVDFLQPKQHQCGSWNAVLLSLGSDISYFVSSSSQYISGFCMF